MVWWLFPSFWPDFSIFRDIVWMFATLLLSLCLNLLSVLFPVEHRQLYIFFFGSSSPEISVKQLFLAAEQTHRSFVKGKKKPTNGLIHWYTPWINNFKWMLIFLYNISMWVQVYLLHVSGQKIAALKYRLIILRISVSVAKENKLLTHICATHFIIGNHKYYSFYTNLYLYIKKTAKFNALSPLDERPDEQTRPWQNWCSKKKKKKLITVVETEPTRNQATVSEWAKRQAQAQSDARK